MSIPHAETTIKVLRVPDDPMRDPYDPPPPPDTIAAGVRAVISTSSGRESTAGGSQSITELRLSCDPYDGGLHHEDTVVDEHSGEEFDVVWSRHRRGMGLDHFAAGLKQVKGLS